MATHLNHRRTRTEDYLEVIAAQLWMFVRSSLPCLQLPVVRIPAVCIDLDGTIWTDDDRQRVFPGVQDALDYFYMHKWYVVFITARRESIRTQTLTQLKELFPDIRFTLYMRSADDMRSIEDYKKQCRSTVRQSCDVLLCIGNNVWDLGFEDPLCANILIPNDMSVMQQHQHLRKHEHQERSR